MSITHLTSLSQLNGILSKSSPTKLTVIDFHAQWCGPCHAIAPKFEALSKQYPTVNFLKCDVDAARDVASQYAVSAMPTFIFIKGSTKVDQVRGADQNALASAVQKHSSGSPASGTSAFAGKGQTLGSSSAPSSNSVPSPRDIANAASGINPQTLILLALVGAYLVFWSLS